MRDRDHHAEPSDDAADTGASPADGLWWGDYELPAGRTARWLLGPLDLQVEHHGSGWDLAWRRSGDRRSAELSVQCPLSEPAFPKASDPELSRRSVLVGGEREPRLVVTPRTADRLVVARPEDGCRVLAGRSVTLYVSTPLWLRVATADGEALFDEPTVRLTDTWFGPSTRVGELAYAIRTRAFPGLEELPTLAFRAITRIRIENTSHGDLELIRLALPAPELSLWCDSEQPELGLWTSHVVLRRSFDGESAQVDVVRGAPPELASPVRVSYPRQRRTRNVLVRAMSAILGQE